MVNTFNFYRGTTIFSWKSNCQFNLIMEITLNLDKFIQINEDLSQINDGEYNLTIEELVGLSILFYYSTTGFLFVTKELDINYDKLETLGFIKIIDNDIVLRDKANLLFSTSSDNIMELVREYRSLFPTGVRTGGYLVRSDEATVANKLRKFLKNNKYSKEQILAATKNYIERKRIEGWKYMKTASYFIYKDNESTLAAECENLNNTSSNITTSVDKML